MTLSNPLPIHPVGSINSEIRPPGSKSITNRALVIAALAKGSSFLRHALDSEDTRLMIHALQSIGVEITHYPKQETILVKGCAGRLPKNSIDIFVGNSGTTIRFLTAMVTLGRGTYRLDGIDRMRQRPIEPLLKALQNLGVNCHCENNTGCPPVVIQANGLKGGQTNICTQVSSQYLSGLLLAAPYAQSNIELRVTGPLVSTPYLNMTTDLMRHFGVTVEAPPLPNKRHASLTYPSSQQNKYLISAPQSYLGKDFTIEPDASAASYFFAAAAITGGKVRVHGLSQQSLQGDLDFVLLLERMGCSINFTQTYTEVCGASLNGIEVDMADISDTVPTLAVVALFAKGPTAITGIEHIRVKETDRIAAVSTELRKLGATVKEEQGGMIIHPPSDRYNSIDGPVLIETYNDHRMAMSFALAGLRFPDVHICDPQCVDKTYPDFFRDLKILCST